ncbi:Cof-type HAD-IIB family hydrolase [Streptococcus sp. DD13]|uniref:Cof-type HAD-IIB family hydrolase n=1 Tax=Streptococcus sp. DD13 TaxID=1777881 RepID=UPI0007985DAB|nr:Cof-type HAD-IIB family hydrolase [Streptococcus sp. DD13]KXT79221.1 Hydrolase (HAD superfamily) [Streptococcus sp. DD13]
MTIKLIALDLDGTLLNSQKEISEANQAALKAARSKGVKVVLTTGRPLPAVIPYLEKLDLLHAEDYSLTFNGGLIQQNDGTILDKIGFNYEDVQRIRKVTDELSLPLDVVQGGDVYVLHSKTESLYASCNPLLHYIPTDFDDLDKGQEFNKAVSSADPSLLDRALNEIPEELFEQYEIFKSRDLILEWSPKGVHKANGLKKLIAHLGIQQEEVMTCGDEDNDFSMIEWAGLGVCMANGSEKVKAVAKVVTPMTNDQDAVAWAVKKYVLEEESDGTL